MPSTVLIRVVIRVAGLSESLSELPGCPSRYPSCQVVRVEWCGRRIAPPLCAEAFIRVVPVGFIRVIPGDYLNHPSGSRRARVFFTGLGPGPPPPPPACCPRPLPGGPGNLLTRAREFDRTSLRCCKGCVVWRIVAFGTVLMSFIFLLAARASSVKSFRRKAPSSAATETLKGR